MNKSNNSVQNKHNSHSALGNPLHNFYLNKDASHYAIIRDQIDYIVNIISPVRIAELRRLAVCSFVKKQVENVVKYPVICVGSFATKLYLPDSDIDLTAFVDLQQGKNWVNELVSTLVQKGLKDDRQDAIPFQIRNVTFVNAETKLVKCVINNIQVDVTDNKVNNVINSTFLMALNKSVGNGDLLTRSILLVKAWCRYDAVGFVQEPLLGSDKSRLTSYGLTTMVLYIFNRFEIDHPLEALAHFFTYFKDFNWKRNVLTIFGPIKTTVTIGKTGTTNISFATCKANCKFTPRLSMKIIERHHSIMLECKKASAGKLSAHNDSLTRFQHRHVNILDPLDDANNIGRSVNKPGLLEMAHAFASGEKYLTTIFGCLAYASHFDQTTAPWDAEQSPITQARTFFQQLFHSSLNKFGRGDGYRPDLLAHPCETWVWKPSNGTSLHSLTTKTKSLTQDSISGHKQISSDRSSRLPNKGGYAAAVISGGTTINAGGIKASSSVDSLLQKSLSTNQNYESYFAVQDDYKACKASLSHARNAFEKICAAMSATPKGTPLRSSMQAGKHYSNFRSRSNSMQIHESVLHPQSKSDRKAPAIKDMKQINKNKPIRNRQAIIAKQGPQDHTRTKSKSNNHGIVLQSRSNEEEDLEVTERYRIRSPKEILRVRHMYNIACLHFDFLQM